MCGIFGIAGFEDRGLMKRMCNILKHRGPDQDGIINESFASIGATRLSIIDVGHGRQPMHNEDNSVFAVANCEIYNFRELKAELEKKGHIFYTNCDTEVILHGYEEFGFDVVKRLHGSFAFAVLDGKKLFLARDHFGINPLYYHFDEKESHFIFASEIKGILEYIDIGERKINNKALVDFFTFMYVPNENTLFEGIYQLRPGSYLIFEDGMVKEEKYWSLEFKEKEAIRAEKVRELVDNAVKRRMMSDVPIGVSLSGGLDSSIVASLVAKHSDEKVRTYSVIFDEVDDRNTKHFVEQVGTDHHEIPLLPEHIKLLPKIIYHNDNLIADPTNIPTFLISQEARKKVKVILTGEGADDFFGGYELFTIMLNSEFNRMHQRSYKRWLRYVSLLRDDFSEEEKGNLLSFNINHNPYQYLQKYFNDNNMFNAVSKIIAENYLPNNLLNKTNSMYLANSVEGRVPFLDLELVNAAAGIPVRLKIRNGVEKWILREAVKGLIPERCRIARKKPFSVPIETLFGNELKDIAFNILSSIDLFRRDYVNEVLELNQKQKTYSRQAWALLVFGIWYNTFIEKEKISF